MRSLTAQRVAILVHRLGRRRAIEELAEQREVEAGQKPLDVTRCQPSSRSTWTSIAPRIQNQTSVTPSRASKKSDTSGRK